MIREKISSAQIFPILLFLFPLLASCHSNKRLIAEPMHISNVLSEGHLTSLDYAGQRLIDSILQVGLDSEALYTLLGSIKPMSTLVSFSYPLADTAEARQRIRSVLDDSHQTYLDSLYSIQQALNALQLPDLKFVMTPYRQSFSGRRHMQVNVIRISLLDSLLEAEKKFFGHFGFVPGADPAVVLNTIEFESSYKRWRGYGYLFGYPPHAVDFFVEAGYQADTSGHFVERDFFAIPVHIREDGHFVYATPKGYQPRKDPDSILLYRAQAVLHEYRRLRPRYLNGDSTLQAYKLLSDQQRRGSQ